MRVVVLFSISSLLIFILTCSSHQAYSQSDVQKELPTGKVNKKVDDYKSPNKPEKKDIQYIYVKNGEKLLIGNPCAIKSTRSMNFEYQKHHRKGNFAAEWKRYWSNTWIKTKLTFTKSPFWKAKIKREIRRCAVQSGDRRG